MNQLNDFFNQHLWLAWAIFIFIGAHFVVMIVATVYYGVMNEIDMKRAGPIVPLEERRRANGWYEMRSMSGYDHFDDAA